MDITASGNACRGMLTLSVLAPGMVAHGTALAGADGCRVGPRLGDSGSAERLEVVVSYQQMGPLRASQVQAMKALGISLGVSMRILPIVGALATALSALEAGEVLGATANPMAGRRRLGVGNGHVDAYEAVAVTQEL